MKLRRRTHRRPPTDQRWFAWHPVKTYDYWVWWEWVERSAELSPNGTIKRWFYRAIEQEKA